MNKNGLLEIGERIEALRNEKGWTQEMLAEKLNIARNTLTKLEGGFRDFKSTEIISIAKTLGVSSDYLLGLSPNECRTESEKDNLIENLREANAKLNDLLNRIHAMTGNE